MDEALEVSHFQPRKLLGSSIVGDPDLDHPMVDDGSSFYDPSDDATKAFIVAERPDFVTYLDLIINVFVITLAHFHTIPSS
jgi:hypothetical protein